jgi:hypothetical protein
LFGGKPARGLPSPRAVIAHFTRVTLLKEFKNYSRFNRFNDATFFGFCYRFIGENNFGQQNFIALFDFSQKSIHF